jgi:CRP/FNR family cyclic AMP-dependent transcriptional regulator
MNDENIEISGPLSVNLEAGEVLCTAGERESDLYIIHSGKLLVFVVKGTQVTPLAFLGPGEYMGELSFFDQEARSANVIAVESSSLVKIPVDEIERQFPDWLVTIAQSITKKLRHTGEVIRSKGIRKKNVETMKPLSMEEQREYFLQTKKYKEMNGIVDE